MSSELVRQLVRYRNVLVALANAGITWVILIVAPLGLFAVILCTLAVFLGSLTIGIIGDVALISLLKAGDVSILGMGDRQQLDPTTTTEAPSSLPKDTQQRLPDEGRRGN